MSNRTQQLVWAVLAVLGSAGTLVMVLFPDLVTGEEAATLGANVPTLVMSAIAVFGAFKAIVTRLRNKESDKDEQT